ncbi:uncharacterized protein EV420DRAFT_1696551 [Desarmillaria tabescens]|uniref:Uncharacterized protein n=1 Tax=Armillaria tabescens TaxID=1929756 RepID=A0AA39N119_ARMTA|nr:uncharacterized protein EV420DRAFT_1696551 [Desarmillaria tabescens]KAK0454022.1 hypothetical protein EV420DRAFT_1696551 [Desarmillaria tabescens]
MVIQADIPPDLTDEDKALAYTLEFLLLRYGVYLVITCSTFIKNRQSFWTVYRKINSVNQAAYLETGITASIWCCWTVWGWRWLIVLLPILSLISATVSKIIEIYHNYSSVLNSISLTLYLSFILTTTLWCTVFIIFRILTVTGVRHGAGGRLRVYYRFIGVLVESSALHSIARVLFLAFYIHNDFGPYYLDPVASIAKGVAPTLLVGRAAAGHTRPTEEHDESATVSTLRFQMASQSSQPSRPSTASFQQSTVQSAVLEMDIEAQQERSDELVVVDERSQ